jgi:hypothetical protein
MARLVALCTSPILDVVGWTGLILSRLLVLSVLFLAALVVRLVLAIHPLLLPSNIEF